MITKNWITTIYNIPSGIKTYALLISNVIPVIYNNEYKKWLRYYTV
jgi:hypothetical protein